MSEFQEEELYGAIARGWCDKRNSGKEMDVDLADAIAIEVLAVVRPLRARVAELETERDALRAEGVAMREACLVACNTCCEFPDADREHFIPRYPSCVEEGCIVYQALSAPLTAAAAERWAKMEAVCEAARGLVWLTGRCPIEYDADIPSRVRDELTALNASLAALAAIKGAPDA